MPAPSITVSLDNGTGTFPFDITSKVLNVDGYDVTRGRDDWQGAVTTGELRLTLNNSDGRFTPGSTILATPSPITVDQRIRVSEVAAGFDVGGFDVGPFDGVGPRFTGYVKSWPVQWPATVTTFATVSLTATDAQARAERRTLRSMLEEEILLDGPSAYYTLSEPEGSTSAGDTSSNQATPLTISGTGAPIAFGADTGLEFTGAQFAGGQQLTLSGATTVLGTGAWTVEAFVLVPTAPPSVNTVLEVDRGSTNDTTAQAVLNITSSGHAQGVVFGGGPGASITGTTNLADSQPHALALTFDGAGLLTLYVDGVVEASYGAAPTLPLPVTRLVVGNGQAALFGTVVASVALTDGRVLSLTRTAAHAQAGRGFAGETGTARISRLAAYAGIPVGTLDTSLTTVPRQDTSGRSAQDAIQEVADAELGLVFVNGAGSLTFHNRARVAAKTAPDLILDSQYVTPDVQPVTDDQQIVNYYEATAAGTGAPSVARNTSSETTHGRYPIAETFLVQTDAEALDRANWIVAKQAEPTARYGTLTINLFKMTSTMAASVVSALDLDCWLRVTSLASQNPGGTIADVVVQGWRVSGDAESWVAVCNVVAKALYSAFVLDSSLLDSTLPLAV